MSGTNYCLHHQNPAPFNFCNLNLLLRSSEDTFKYFKMAKYSKLINAGTTYSKHMNRLSNRIFGDVTRYTKPKSMKVIQMFSEMPVNKRPEILSYYPRHTQTSTLIKVLRNYGLFRDEHQDFRDEYDRLRELRGKRKWIPPPLRKEK